jgi:putative FmdB family regulatory protein
MPLYEYECRVCGHRFEVIQKFADAPLETCPKCGGAVQKLLSAPAFQFKGSGWYITDYARKDQGAGKEDSSSGGATSPAKDSGGSGAATSGPADGAKDTDTKSEKSQSAPASGSGTSASSKDAG